MGVPILERPLPLQCAPMAGVSTPRLAAAVSQAGGLGFLAAGFLDVDAMAAEVAAYRGLTEAPVALNLFTPQIDRTAELAARLGAYAEALRPEAERYGVATGEPRFDDDGFDAKLAWLLAHPVDAVTFTFGPVPAAAVAALRAAGTAVGFTVTGAGEAREAVALDADFLVAQGADAGGHRGTWHVADQPNTDPATSVVRACARATGLPVVGAGGVDGPAAVQALLDAGATAVAVGTLFVAAEEGRAVVAHQEALTSGEFTEATVTRAFSGRYARALANEFVRGHDDLAPAAYPNVHHLVKPVRAAATRAGETRTMALWAGSGHRAAVRRPAADVVASLVG